MFGRDKVECPRCKKMFRKKDMINEDDYDLHTSIGDSFRHYNPTTDTWVETLCVDCYAKGQKIADEYNENFEKGKKDQEELIETWSHKASSSEKLSRLYQEKHDLFMKRLDTRERLGQAQINVIDVGKFPGDSVEDHPTSILGVAFDLLNESYKSKPGYQIAVAEQGRIEASLNDLDRAITKNRDEILKEIGRIEENGNKEPDGKAESTVKRLQNLMDNTISEVINRAEQHSSNWQTKRDGIKEPVEQNNDNSFCDNCGKSLKPTAKFCGSCGTPRA